MKKLAMVLSAISIVTAAGIGHADSTLASCSAPLNISGVCSADFTMGSRQSVTLQLNPALGFTGTLTAQVKHPGSPIGYSVTSVVAAGLPAPLPGTSSSITVILPAGDWTLTVHTYGSFCEYPVGCQTMPNLGIGSFGASVSRASTGS